MKLDKMYVVLLPIDCHDNPRGICEEIEGRTYFPENEKTVSALTISKVIEERYSIKGVEVEPMDDFMERVNDEDFNPDNYFMSYVSVQVR